MILNLKISFFYSNIILIYCLYRDIKYRKISNKVIIRFLLISSLIVFTEDLGIYNNLVIFVLTKIYFLFFVFLFSLILFCFKIIGGADGKLLIILAFLYPTHSFNFQWIFTFFFIFLFLYVLLMLVNFLLNNGLSGNNSYDMIHGLEEKLPIPHKVFIILFYKFLDFSQINSYTDEKFILKSLNLFFNEKKEKFQILTQFRPPLAILILLTNNYVLLNYFY